MSQPKATSKPISILPQASSSTPTTSPIKAKMHKPSTISTAEAEKMAPYDNPVQIGTRGTVGSLVMKEIEYFNQLELSGREDFLEEKPRSRVMDMEASSSTSHAPNPTYESVLATQKKKKSKKRGGNKLLPSMCSMVEVSDNNRRPVGVSGFGYKNLKTDVKNLQA